MLSLICNRVSICKQSVKALMGISAEFYSDKIDINFIDVNAKSLWPFSTFVNQVLKFYSHFACSERLRKFPIKYGDLYICGRGVRKLPVQYWHRNHCCIWLVVAIHIYYIISTLLKYLFYLNVYIVKCNCIYVIHGFENNAFFFYLGDGLQKSFWLSSESLLCKCSVLLS